MRQNGGWLGVARSDQPSGVCVGVCVCGWVGVARSDQPSGVPFFLVVFVKGEPWRSKTGISCTN